MNDATQSFIQTYSGRRFYPFNPRPADISLEDIAHSQAHICRFGGHCMRFYPVAEHAILVSKLMPPRMRLWGLLHDAAESIGGDMVRPMKHTEAMAPFRAAEHAVQACMYTKFGLSINNEPYDILKMADKAAVKLEMYHNLLGGPLPEMAAYVADVPMPPSHLKIEFFDPVESKCRFLNTFHTLLEAHWFH